MNKSNYINPENCKKCGSMCCKSFSIIYQKELEKIDKNMFSEVQRFKELDSNGKIVVTEDKNNFEVTFNFPCKHLIAKGSYSYYCDIYDSDSRPLLCKEFPYHNTTKLDCPFRKINNENN